MDDAICKGKELQQCYQYLRRVECGISLARFHANPSKPEGSPKDCLPILMRYFMESAVACLFYLMHAISAAAVVQISCTWSLMHCACSYSCNKLTCICNKYDKTADMSNTRICRLSCGE